LYKSDETPAKNSFGVSIQHTVDLVKKDDGWIIFTDWYTDCFEDALKSYSADTDNLDRQTSPPKYNINSCSKNKGNLMRKGSFEDLIKPWDLGWGDKNIFFHSIHIK